MTVSSVAALFFIAQQIPEFVGSSRAFVDLSVCHLIGCMFYLFAVSVSQSAASGCAGWSLCPHSFSL